MRQRAFFLLAIVYVCTKTVDTVTPTTSGTSTSTTSTTVVTGAYNDLLIPPTLSGKTFDLALGKSTKQYRTGSATNTYGYKGMSFWGPTLIMNMGDNVQMNVTNNLTEATTGKLKKYGEEHKINPSKWYLLTGSKEEIYTLARKSFFAEKRIGLEKTSNQFLHTEAMLLIDKKGRIRGVYNAAQVADIERVTEEINILLKENI
jgi:hypothetical protein